MTSAIKQERIFDAALEYHKALSEVVELRDWYRIFTEATGEYVQEEHVPMLGFMNNAGEVKMVLLTDDMYKEILKVVRDIIEDSVASTEAEFFLTKEDLISAAESDDD